MDTISLKNKDTLILDIFGEKKKPSVFENPHRSLALPDATQRHTCTHMKDMQVQPIKDYPWRTQRVSQVFFSYFFFSRHPSHSSPQFKSLWVAGCCLENTVKINRWELFFKATVRKGWVEGWQTKEQRRKTVKEGSMGGVGGIGQVWRKDDGGGKGNKGGESVEKFKGRRDERNSSVVTYSHIYFLNY